MPISCKAGRGGSSRLSPHYKNNVIWERNAFTGSAVMRVFNGKKMINEQIWPFLSFPTNNLFLLDGVSHVVVVILSPYE